MTTPSKPSAWLDAFSRRMGLGLILALALGVSGCAPKLGGSEDASITTTTGNGKPGDPGTDFTLAVAQSQVTVPAGGRGSNGVSVAWINCAPASIQLDPDGLPQGLTVAFNTNPTPDLSSLTVAATPSVPAGTYPIRLLGKVGQLQHDAKFDLVVPPAPGFALALSPASLDVAAGGSGKLDVAIQRLGGFTDPVALSLTGAPAGVTGTFTTVPVPAASGGGLVEEDHSLLLSVDASVQPGIHTLTVHGASGGVDHAVSFFLKISPVADFSFSLSPTGISANQTDAISGASTITLSRAAGFTGAVTFTASGAPAGVTPRITPNPAAGASASLDFLMNLPQPGDYPIHVTGQSGTVSHAADLVLTIHPGGPDFQVTAPATATADLTGLATGTKSITVPVGVTALAGFNRPVSLSASGLPAGATAVFSPATVTPTGTSTLTLTLPASTPAGTSTLTLTGDGGSGLTHTATLRLTVVNPGTFTLSAAPDPLTVAIGPANGSYTGSATVSVAPANGFSGGVTLVASGLPVGVTASFAPNPTTGTSLVTFTATLPGAAPGTYPVTLSGTSGPLSASTTLTLDLVSGPDFTLAAAPSPVSIQIPTPAASPATGRATVTVTPLNGYTKAVTLSATGLPTGVTATFAPNPATGASTLTFQVADTAAAGSSTVTVTGTDGTLTRSTTLTLTLTAAQDFSLGLASGAGATVPGGSIGDSLTLTPVNGFASDVTLSLAGAPAGITAAFSPNPVTSASGYASKVTFSVAGTVAPGTYALTIQGTGAGLTRTVAYTLTVRGFILSAAPDPLIVVRGARTPATGTLTQTALSGFSGTVNLSVATALPAGLAVSLAPGSITGSGTATISATATAGLATGDYPVTLQGVDSATGLTRTTTFTIRVQDFALTTNSPLIFHGAQGAGNTGSGTLTLSALNGYADTVSLATTPPAGLSYTMSPASLSGSGNSTIQVQVTTRLLTAGVYSGTISGTDTSTGIAHSAPFNVVVEDYTLAAGSATTSGTFSWAGSGTMALNLDPAATGFTFDESITWSVTGTADSTGTQVTYWSYTITPNPTSTSDTGITLGFSLAPPATGVPSGTYFVSVQGVSAATGVTHLATFTITVL